MLHAGLIVTLVALTTGIGGAETLLERVKRGSIAWVAPGDPDMDAAIRKARETLPDFLRLARTPSPTITSLAVKVAIPAGNDNEYFWISPFEQRGGKFSGRINNTPRIARTVRLGQVIEFSEAEIVDWLYRDGGRMHGNFTACALLKREPHDQAQALMQRYGLSCGP
jgi:uncharacterized protein YegJ (DUF2314 family)